METTNKTIAVLNTRKFTRLNKGQIYYVDCGDCVRQIRFSKAMNHGSGEGYLELEYELAGVGKKTSNKEMYIYLTEEDAIKGKSSIHIAPYDFSKFLYYCSDKKIVTYHYSNSPSSTYKYIDYYYWTGTGVAHDTGRINIRYDYLSGKIIVDGNNDNVYATYDDCKNSNSVKVYRF